jgi:uncharacterized membrane protein
MAKSSIGLEENVAGMLCYLIGWISGLVFFLIEKENKNVRFHALQSLILFLGLQIIMFVLGFVPFLGLLLVPIIGIGTFILWILLMVKAFKGERVNLPVVNELVEKYV